MRHPMRIKILVATCISCLLAFANQAGAEYVRFRYVPVDACGNMTQVPAGPGGALGEQLNGFGLRPQPYPGVMRTNQLVTFRHPFNGRNVTVPLTLPQGNPRLEYQADRIVYNYGAYVVEARFFP